MPVGLHFDVFPQHVESHLLAGLYVILEGSISGGCVNAIWPIPLHVNNTMYLIGVMARATATIT